LAVRQRVKRLARSLSPPKAAYTDWAERVAASLGDRARVLSLVDANRFQRERGIYESKGFQTFGLDLDHNDFPDFDKLVASLRKLAGTRRPEGDAEIVASRLNDLLGWYLLNERDRLYRELRERDERIQILEDMNRALKAAVAERDRRLRRKLFGRIGGSIAALFTLGGVVTGAIINANATTSAADTAAHAQEISAIIQRAPGRATLHDLVALAQHLEVCSNDD
jgi:hypothetical protein